MYNEQKIKKAWQTPEIIELDLDETEGKVSSVSEYFEYGAS